MALNLRSGRKNEIMRMILIFLENLKIWSHGGPRSIAHLLRSPARLNRYPRIFDARGFSTETHSLGIEVGRVEGGRGEGWSICTVVGRKQSALSYSATICIQLESERMDNTMRKRISAHVCRDSVALL